MLESRIDKLRSLESKIKTDTVCTKKNCPVALDPRTTSEKFLNEEQTSFDQQLAREARERIERFKATQQMNHSS